MSTKLLALGLIVSLSIGLPTCYLLYVNLNQEQFSQNLTTPSPAPIKTPLPTQSTISNSTISDSRLFCSVDKYQTSSNWVGNSPVIAYYYPDGEFEPKYIPVPQNAYLYLRISNNNSQPLYNAIVKVNYQTSEGSWKTVSQTIGSLDVFGLKTVNLTLANPALKISNSTQLYVQDSTPHSVNIMYYVLSKEYFEFSAYGFSTEG